MKIKICFFIFSLQFLLYSCDPVKYYQSQIPKYSDEVTVDPQNYFAVGFVLNIEDFQENEYIYFRITLDKDDAKDDAENIDYMTNFESTFDITEETTLTEFLYLERVDFYMTKNSRTSFYFQTTKDNADSKFFKFVIKSKTFFKSNIGFKNGEKEEFEKETEDFGADYHLIIFITLFVVIFLLILSPVFCLCCCGSKKSATVIPMQQQMIGQQMYSQPQIYGQQMYGQQMNEQQQMIDQQGINEENNMNSVVQNNQTNPTPTNQNEISPMNKVDQNNQTNEKSPKS